MKTVVLVSGGIDSFVAYRLIKKQGKDVEAIYIDFEHPYARRELKALKESNIPFKKITITGLLRKEFGNKPDNANVMIPGRNVLVTLLAAIVGADEIVLSALDGEMHEFATDKNQKFMDMMSELLTYSFSKFKSKITIYTPFKHMSKKEVVAMALEEGLATKEEILKTSSCLDVHNLDKPCGNCIVCARRWGIFKQLGFEEEYLQNPLTSKNGKAYIDKLIDAYKRKDYSHYSKKRLDEVIPALKMEGVI